MKFIGRIAWFFGQIWQIFTGADQNLSGRRILGTVCIIVGVDQLSQIVYLPLVENIDMWLVVYRLSPGALLVLCGSYFWRWISEQNIKSLIEAGRGK